MKNKIYLIASAFVLLISIFSWFYKSEGSADCQQLCALPGEERWKRFQSYPIEKQYNLYLTCDNEKACDMDSERISSYLAWNMAYEGAETTVSFLVNKLREEESQETQERIIVVLYKLARKQKLNGRKDVAELVNQKVKHMKDGFIQLVRKRLLGGQTRKEYLQEFARKIDESADKSFPEEVSVSQLIADYQENSVAASTEYNGKTLTFTATVSHNAELNGVTSVHLENGSVICSSDQSSQSDVHSNLKRGEVRKFVGVVGNDLDIILLTKCKIK
jgi:hypothetical protein